MIQKPFQSSIVMPITTAIIQIRVTARPINMVLTSFTAQLHKKDCIEF